jgi:hypothetical protein
MLRVRLDGIGAAREEQHASLFDPSRAEPECVSIHRTAVSAPQIPAFERWKLVQRSDKRSHQVVISGAVPIL